MINTSMATVHKENINPLLGKSILLLRSAEKRCEAPRKITSYIERPSASLEGTQIYELLVLRSVGNELRNLYE